MQEKTNGNKNLLISMLILLAVIVAGYFYTTRDRSTDALLISTSAVDNPSSVENKLLSILSQLKSLKLDNSIFSDPVWLTLNDFGQVLAPQPAGRPNPFAPLESTVGIPANPNSPVIQNQAPKI